MVKHYFACWAGVDKVPLILMEITKDYEMASDDERQSIQTGVEVSRKHRLVI